MKTLIVLLAMLVVSVAEGQTPKQAAQAPRPNDHTMTTVLPPKLDPGDLVIKTDQPNEIKGRKFTCSGVAVQAVKSKEPWQLINPFAPAAYGPGHQNLDRDIITGRVTGFKFFSISF
jgi:hypothetical protein